MKTPLLLLLLLTSSLSALAYPELPMRDGQLDRQTIIETMIHPMYGAWPSEALVREPGERVVELDGDEQQGARYLEWTLSLPRAPEKKLRLGLFLPKGVAHPVVFLTLNKCGNHSLHPHPGIPEGSLAFRHPTHCKDVGRGSHAGKYGVQQLLARGFALATFAEADIDADSSRQRAVGIKGLFEHPWGTISAWAWGLSQAADVLKAELAPQQLITTGHSRRGKAALLAAALNAGSIDATYPHHSGLGGTASLRNTQGRESARLITHGGLIYRAMGEGRGLTHFFSPEFKRPSRRPDDLPYDAHFLIALVAPRRMVDFQCESDFWAGPESAARMMELAALAWGPEVRAAIAGHEKLPERSPQLLTVRFPWGHQQDERFWQAVIAITNQ